MHLMALHVHGSSNPLGVTGNLDRLPMHGYFIFKDLVTVFVFLIFFSLFVFFSPNTLGQIMALLIIIILYNIILIYNNNNNNNINNYLIIRFKFNFNKLYNISSVGQTQLSCVWDHRIYLIKNIYIILFIYILLIKNKYVIINMYCAICWKSLKKWYNNNININIILKIYNKTQYYIKNNMNIISDLLNPNRVKYYYKEDNQQVTNINNIYFNNNNYLLVDTSETTRTYKNKNKIMNKLNLLFLKLSLNIQKRYNSILLKNNLNYKFNQWLAGLIDGNGYFNITKGKYPNCEILVELKDEKILRQIQNKFGGSIKLRSGVKTIRYRLNNKEGIIKLINAVNGNIRNSKRLVQFNKVCSLLNINFKEPIKLNNNNAWFIGFFDAKGTINYYYKDNNNKLKIIPQLTINVTNKYLYDIEYYKNVFGGNIYFDKGQNGYFKWSINNKELHNIFYTYNKYCPSKSYKGKRLFLINKFYYLYDLLAFRAPDNTALYKAWLKFDDKWNNNNNNNI